MQNTFFLAILLLNFSAVAYECPPEFKNRSKLPACGKTSRPQILSDNYPVGAIVVGKPDTDAIKLDPMQQSYELIYSMAKFQDPLPLIVLPITNADFFALRNKLLGSDLDNAAKNRLMQRLAHAEVKESFNWQQDYMQATIGRNGQPQLRENKLYTQMRPGSAEHFGAVSKVLEKCGVGTGEPLTPPGFIEAKKVPNGASGGNIEALPDGSCLIGDDAFPTKQHYDKFVEHICDPKDNIKVPTHWLGVGHTDEIMKILPKPNGKAPCNFSVAIASPDLAMELLRKKGDDRFISPEIVPPEHRNTEEMLSVRREVNSSLKRICSDLEMQKYPLEGGSAPDDPSGVNSNSYFRFLDHILTVVSPLAHAEWDGDEERESVLDAQSDSFFEDKSIADAEKEVNVMLKAEDGSISEAEPAENKGVGSTVTCSNATNNDLANLYRDNDVLSRTNKYVQQHMDLLEDEVSQKMRAKYPTCNIEIMKFPQLFEGKFDSTGKLSEANSINPNPTNSVVIGKHIYIPDQNNSAFQKDLKEKMLKMGLIPHFVNTFEFAHSMQGNLHCSTQTIPLCR